MLITDGIAIYWLSLRRSGQTLYGCHYWGRALGLTLAFLQWHESSGRTINHSQGIWAALRTATKFRGPIRQNLRLPWERFSAGDTKLALVPWFNGGKAVKQPLLGITFKIKGRFSTWVGRVIGHDGPQVLYCILTGSRVRTIPGQRELSRAKRKGPEVTTLNPSALVILAAGAYAIPAWRIKQGNKALSTVIGPGAFPLQTHNAFGYPYTNI